jgi:hypothetical protein
MFKQSNYHLLRQGGFGAGQIKSAFKEFQKLDLEEYEDEFVKGVIFEKRHRVNPTVEDISRWRPRKAVMDALVEEGYQQRYIEIEAKNWASQFILSDRVVVNLSATFKKWFLAKHANTFPVETFCDRYKRDNPADAESKSVQMALAEFLLEWQGRGDKLSVTWEKLFEAKLHSCKSYLDDTLHIC